MLTFDQQLMQWAAALQYQKNFPFFHFSGSTSISLYNELNLMVVAQTLDTIKHDIYRIFLIIAF